MRYQRLFTTLVFAICLLAHSPESFAEPVAKSGAVTINPPADSDIPNNELGESIRLGKKILSETGVYAKEFTGNGLKCTSCHLDNGLKPNAGPWAGLWGVFPEFRSRNAKVNMLAERVNDCFLRSMNGKAIPADSDKMTAILSYMWWISKGVPTGSPVEGRGFSKIKPDHEPDAKNGEKLYAEKCSACHGADGSGQKNDQGGYDFPPLWGAMSYNIGAGMARLNTAAAFIKWNMPMGDEGSLTNQEAYDIATFFINQPRPDFPGKEKDWPKGDKPKDARY